MNTQKTSVIDAVRKKQYAIVEMELKKGANVNTKDKSNKPILFLANGAHFDVFNRYNGTALIPACERGHLDVVKILANTKGFPIDHVNRLGWTALLEAVVLGNGSSKYVEIVQLLVDAGININIPDNDGITAVQHAKSRSYSGIVKVLEKASKKQ